MPLFINAVLHPVMQKSMIGQTTQQGNLQTTARQTPYSGGNIIFVHQKLRYVLRVQIPASCQAQILALAWIWTMTEARSKCCHSPGNI